MTTPSNNLAAARAAKKKAQSQFGAWPQVVALGVTRTGAEYAVKISLKDPLPPSQRIPSSIDGVPIVVQVTGPIRKSDQRGT
jgi:hypothetical protein